jgi:hypothetical protein
MNATAIARKVLTFKSPAARAFARTIVAGKPHPFSAETRAKLSDALRRRMAMSDRELRQHVAAKRGRWLSDCIVVDGDRKVFALDGVDPATGVPYDIRIDMPLDASLLDFLLLVMRCQDAPMTMRLDAAKTAAILTHERKAPVKKVVVDKRKGRRA